MHRHHKLSSAILPSIALLATVTSISIGLGEDRRKDGPASSLWQVGTLQETRHVLRSEAPGAGRAIQLAAARNEWRGFQVLLRSPEAVPGVRVEPAALRGPGGAVLGLKNVRLYRQHQFWMDSGTHRNDAFKPDGYPDPLIPLALDRAEGTRALAPSKAERFDLPARATHGFWVDLFVPNDTPPGEYRGTYRVVADHQPAVEIPVALTVWDFTLPVRPALVTEFGSPIGGLREYYGKRAKSGKEAAPRDWNAVEAQCAQVLCEHRLNATPPPTRLHPAAQPDGSFRIPPAEVRALESFVDRYAVNALMIPHPESVVKDPERERDKLRAWLAAFDALAKQWNRPEIVFYTYLRDEPNTLEDYRYVQKWGRAVREARSVVKVLVVEQTWTEPGAGGADSAWGDLYGAVDIWCPLFSLHRQESAARRQAAGETIWTYTALCQGSPTPWWHIDFPLLNYRVPAWIAWRYRMRGLLYWGGLSYWREVEDPWSQAPAYTGRGVYQQGQKGIAFFGEGSLVYPARDVGFQGIVPSLRLKALRDAIQDYDYLALLERHGKAPQADAIVTPLAGSFLSWEKNPAEYDKARARLAALILSPSKRP